MVGTFVGSFCISKIILLVVVVLLHGSKLYLIVGLHLWNVNYTLFCKV